MKELEIMYEPGIKNKKKEDYPEWRVPSGCAIFGIANESGISFSGAAVIEGITMMHDRSNGLGGGFAAYGIYPDYADEDDEVIDFNSFDNDRSDGPCEIIDKGLSPNNNENANNNDDFMDVSCSIFAPYWNSVIT